MDKLLKGLVEFREKDFAAHKELFGKLGSEQKPHTLFIGCSDSRVVPNLITHTLPGELFIVRNIGNLVPPWRETEEYVSTTSAVEYAVQVLEVENIVVCGHSNCGACASVFKDSSVLKGLPHVRKWLELLKPIREKAEAAIAGGSPEAKEWLAEQMNVVEQLKNLLTYPFIREKYQIGKLKLYGWYYVIQTGEVYNYDKDKGYFELIGVRK